jgi:Cu/Ag efflux protein CusF
MMHRVLVVGLLAAAVAVSAAAQTPAPAAKPAAAQPPASVSKTAIVTETATIVAIDSTNRLVALKGADGAVETIAVAPEMQRFAELKVGDVVTFKYHESVVFAIQKPGDKAPVDKASVERGTGAKPSGKVSQTLTTVVTVMAIDAAVPSITIKNDKGETMHFKVEDKANLTGVKVGDKVQVTYTQALAVSVEEAKPAAGAAKK